MEFTKHQLAVVLLFVFLVITTKSYMFLSLLFPSSLLLLFPFSVYFVITLLLFSSLFYLLSSILSLYFLNVLSRPRRRFLPRLLGLFFLILTIINFSNKLSRRTYFPYRLHWNIFIFCFFWNMGLNFPPCNSFRWKKNPVNLRAFLHVYEDTKNNGRLRGNIFWN